MTTFNQEDHAQQKLRKRRLSWERAAKARQALAPYLEAAHAEDSDLRIALTDFFTDVRHLADMDGVNIFDEETLTAIIERSELFYQSEESEQWQGPHNAPKK